MENTKVIVDYERFKELKEFEENIKEGKCLVVNSIFSTGLGMGYSRQTLFYTEAEAVKELANIINDTNKEVEGIIFLKKRIEYLERLFQRTTIWNLKQNKRQAAK